MTPHQGLRISSWALIAFAALFYLASVAGFLFGGASAWNDLGVYAVTIILLGFGGGGLLLRRTRIAAEAHTQ